VRELRARRLLEVREAGNVVSIGHGAVDGGRIVEVAFERGTYALLGAA
jgi:hypothetical protein